MLSCKRFPHVEICLNVLLNITGKKTRKNELEVYIEATDMCFIIFRKRKDVSETSPLRTCCVFEVYQKYQERKHLPLLFEVKYLFQNVKRALFRFDMRLWCGHMKKILKAIVYHTRLGLP